MPITFQPPDPVAPYTSAAYGAGQQYSQDSGAIANAYQMQFQAKLAQAQLQSQAQQAAAAHSAAAGQAYMQQSDQQSQQQFLGQQAAFNRAQDAQMQQQQQYQSAQQQNQQAQLAVQVQQQELNQAEQMQLQKYQSADAWVDQQLNAGLVTQDEAANLKAQTRGLKGPLELKQEQAKTQLMQSQAQQQQQLVAQETQQQLKKAALAAQTAEERTVPVIDKGIEAQVRQDMGDVPQMGGIAGAVAKQEYEKEVRRRVLAKGGLTHIYTDVDGKTYIIKPEKPASNEETGHLTENAFNSTVRQAEHNRDSVIKKLPPETQAAWDIAKRQEALSNDLRAHFGMPNTDEQGRQLPPPTYEEFAAFRNYQRSRGGSPAMGGKQQQYSGFGAKPGQAAPGAAPTAPAQAENKPVDPQPAEKPFHAGKPETMTKPQHEQISLWQDGIRRINEAPLTEGQKASFHENVQWAVKQLADYGAMGNMPAPVVDRYKRIIQAVGGLPKKQEAKTPVTPLTPRQSEDALRGGWGSRLGDLPVTATFNRLIENLPR